MADITDKFKVKDQNGNVYVVLVLQDRLDTTTFGDETRSYTYGLKELRLQDGRHVNMIDDDTFQIVQSGERVTRIK